MKKHEQYFVNSRKLITQKINKTDFKNIFVFLDTNFKFHMKFNSDNNV